MFLPQELPLKVQQVLGLYTPPSSVDEVPPGAETQLFLDRPAAAASAGADLVL